jgi:hypothetical protein
MGAHTGRSRRRAERSDEGATHLEHTPAGRDGLNDARESMPRLWARLVEHVVMGGEPREVRGHVTIEPTAKIVVEPRAEEFRVEDPTAPKVGRWYWFTETVSKTVGWQDEPDGDGEDVPINAESTERHFVCVVRIGSNYAKIQSLGHERHGSESSESCRVHLDDFADRCTFVPNPEQVIAEHTRRHQETIVALMQEVRDVTARLAITPGLGLPGGPTETQSLALTLARDQPASEYKTALTVAKEKTLPELFERIKGEHAVMARWMSAPLIPMKAAAAAMEPAIAAVEDRLFSVELYAGLCEEIVQLKKGEPAPLQEKIRIFQRRAYMDEECLAAYETGGMDFKSLKEFDRWLCKPAQLDRLLPFQRCILAFQVRRNRKDRKAETIAGYFHIQDEEALDKLTFLYIRNGGRVYRLGTEIDFDTQLFPDRRSEDASGKLYARKHDAWEDRDNAKSRSWYIRSEHEVDAMSAEYEQRLRNWKIKIKSVPKKERWHSEHDRPKNRSENFRPFDSTNVYYDDIAASIVADVKRHNRLVLVLQGILDRSEALHPHPPWSLWRQDSFQTAIELVYDDDRVLTPGDRPDFEAYRTQCNSLVKIGSVMLGQESIWSRIEASREAQQERRSSRGFGGRSYTPEHYFPPGNPGPGKFAHAAAVKGKTCTFQWVKRRHGHEYDNSPDPDHPGVGCKLTLATDKLFNVDAYKPGDFRIFFTDPRTRAEYLRWAPILLEAEEYHAGNRKVAPVKPMPARKARTPGGSYEYRQRKERQAKVGLAVRLVQDVKMKLGPPNKKSTLWRVRDASKKGYELEQITEDGKPMKDGRRMTEIPDFYFEIAAGVPPEKET